ncbi:MAG: hypothetical protein K9G30_04855, partial [Parvibaculum sp.]|nr:hypothetical protein [Parvibaculum sp.]
WPVALATFDGNAMFVRAGTPYHSPFSTDSDFLNQRLPMLVSALGRAYLAFCPEGEQRTILDVLRASTASADVAARDTTYVERLIAGIRARGYASTAPIPGDPAMGIAVPIMEGEHAAATMTMRYFASVMSEEEAAERYLVPMQHAAAAIAANLQETSIEVSGA